MFAGNFQYMDYWRRCKSAEVAQLVEQPIRNRQVPGSSPGLGSILKQPPHPVSLALRGISGLDAIITYMLSSKAWPGKSNIRKNSWLGGTS